MWFMTSKRHDSLMDNQARMWTDFVITTIYDRYVENGGLVSTRDIAQHLDGRLIFNRYEVEEILAMNGVAAIHNDELYNVEQLLQLVSGMDAIELPRFYGLTLTYNAISGGIIFSKINASASTP